MADNNPPALTAPLPAGSNDGLTPDKCFERATTSGVSTRNAVFSLASGILGFFFVTVAKNEAMRSGPARALACITATLMALAAGLALLAAYSEARMWYAWGQVLLGAVGGATSPAGTCSSSAKKRNWPAEKERWHANKKRSEGGCYIAFGIGAFSAALYLFVALFG